MRNYIRFMIVITMLAVLALYAATACVSKSSSDKDNNTSVTTISIEQQAVSPTPDSDKKTRLIITERKADGIRQMHPATVARTGS